MQQAGGSAPQHMQAAAPQYYGGPPGAHQPVHIHQAHQQPQRLPSQPQQQYVGQAPPPSYNVMQQRSVYPQQQQPQRPVEPHKTVLEKSPLWASLQEVDTTDTILCAKLAREVVAEIARKTNDMMMSSKCYGSIASSQLFLQHSTRIEETLAYCTALFDRLNELVTTVMAAPPNVEKTDEWIDSFLERMSSGVVDDDAETMSVETAALIAERDAIAERLADARNKLYDLAHEAHAIQWYILASKTPAV